MKYILLVLMNIFVLGIQANPVTDMLERIDKGASKKFKIELKASEKDYFELSQDGKKIVVKGNTWVNIATGINWYLKYYAGIHLSWNNMHQSLPVEMPRVLQPERHETDLRLRY
ncbi:MAG: alpha-N-acetylglucosaminidase N-terminal domain-containing protein, partial [Prevotella sp.]|nr:alpha-N-acetylglucosaminidase N-terminal domain-containing protein [Prevotella sp.]